jgi:hypothetical protein
MIQGLQYIVGEKKRSEAEGDESEPAPRCPFPSLLPQQLIFTRNILKNLYMLLKNAFVILAK